MRINTSFALLLCSLTTFSGMATTDQAAYSELLNRLNLLLKTKDYLSAYQLADLNTYEYGGEPEFDLLAGFAAYGGEKYQEAVFVFERVVVSKPGSFLGRYYLALSYYKVDNLHAAITELEKLQQRPLSQTQKEKTEALLERVNRDLVNRNLNWYALAAARIAYDSNINGGTDATSISIPIGDTTHEFQLSDESRAIKDMSYGFSALAGYQHPLSQYQWLKLDLSANYLNYGKNSEFQRQQLGFTFAYEQELLRGKVSVSGFSRPMWLEQEVASDGAANNTTTSAITKVEREVDLYRTDNGVSLFFQKNTSRKTSYRAGLSYSILDHELNSELDLSRLKVSGAFQYKTRLLHTLSSYYSKDDSKQGDFDHNAKTAVNLTYQLTWPITNTLVNNNSVALEQHEYQAPHQLFQKTRKDDLSVLSSQLIFNTSDALQLKLQLNLINRDSNIDLFDYDRLELSGSWQYRF